LLNKNKSVTVQKKLFTSSTKQYLNFLGFGGKDLADPKYIGPEMLDLPVPDLPNLNPNPNPNPKRKKRGSVTAGT